ncbi:tyrosine-type recombinase/integrase [Sinorhizobium fredii]|uniref:tyrosine-type recombinase/integrase n=1 Tax=Rhizobium fredii TaxID=380 RepID=UPI003513459F
MGLTLLYVQEPTRDRGTFHYRRRVSSELKPFIGKGEIKASLGRTREEALRKYPAVHAAAEKALARAQREHDKAQRRASGLETVTKLERYHELMEEIAALGLDDPDHASIVAETIAARYPEDEETGDPLIDDEEDTIRIAAIQGRPLPPPQATLSDAKKLYVSERLHGNELEYRKKLLRVERIIAAAEEALSPAVPALADWTRDHAKQVRDHYIKAKGLKPSSVKRELNTLKGIWSLWIKEKEPALRNPFAGLELPKSVEAESEARHPLPEAVEIAVSEAIEAGANDDIKLIWRLLRGTGCRIAEITGLRVQDVDVSSELPHLKIVAHEGRRLKTKSSAREVPLIGDAKAAAEEAIELATGSPLFARYAGKHGPTTASATLMKWIRLKTADKKLVVHSLRHSMSDRLVMAEVSTVDRNAILGHLNAGVGEATYGGRLAKLKALTKAMEKVWQGD